MPIHFNGSGMKEIYLGSQPIAEVYKGGDLVWQKHRANNHDIVKGLALYNNETVWEKDYRSSVGTLKKDWTITASLPEGSYVQVGGASIRNVGGVVSVKAVSNRATMEYSAPGVYTEPPLVIFGAGKDNNGYRTRLWVDGHSVGSYTNGGPLKLWEDTNGGDVIINAPWAIFKPGVDVYNVHQSNELPNIPHWCKWGAARINAVAGNISSSDPMIYKAVPGFKYRLFLVGAGGYAAGYDTGDTSVQRGGGAGEVKLAEFKPGEAVQVAQWKNTRTRQSTRAAVYVPGAAPVWKFSALQGAHGSMPTVVGGTRKDIPPSGWGYSLPGRAPTGPTGKRATGEGGYFKVTNGAIDKTVGEGGSPQHNVYLCV